MTACPRRWKQFRARRLMSPKDLWSRIRPYRLPLLALLVSLLLVAAVAPRLILGPQVNASTVVQRDLLQTLVASGHVEAPHRVEIGAQLIGTVARVPVAEGQAVSAGQDLIVLDDTESRATLEQAELAVRLAQARLRQVREVQAPMARQAVRQAQVTLDNARTQLKRQQDLFNQAFVGQAALDEARKSVDLAQAQLASAGEQLKSLLPTGSELDLAQAALDQARASAGAARARLGYATIRAPADGVLISRDVEPGDVVQPGKALMVLSPAGETQLVVQVDEKNLALLALGQPALASADAYPEQRFQAELVYINPGIDAQRGSVEVKFRVPSPPAYLRQDMTVSVDVEVARRSQAVLVPVEAVQDASGHAPWVLVADDGRARRRPLVLGLRAGGVCEVLHGLHPGDRVIPTTAGAVHDGQRVRVTSDE
jgi:HlyD family secretion protein